MSVKKQKRKIATSKLAQYKSVEALIKKAFTSVDKYVQKDLNSSKKVSISFR